MFRPSSPQRQTNACSLDCGIGGTFCSAFRPAVASATGVRTTASQPMHNADWQSIVMGFH